MTTTQLDPKQPDFELIPKSPADVAKAITYSVFAILGALIGVTNDDVVTNPEILILGSAVLGFLGVWWVRGTIAKTLLAFASAGVQAAALIISDAVGFGDVTLNQWLIVIVTAGAAIGVGIVPNGGVAAIAKQVQRDGRHELGGRPIHVTDLSSSVSQPPAGGSGVSTPESKVMRVELSAADREFLTRLGKGGYTGRTIPGHTGFTIPD